MDHYLSFKLSKTLSLAWFGFYLPSKKNYKNMIICKRKTDKIFTMNFGLGIFNVNRINFEFPDFLVLINCICFLVSNNFLKFK